MHFAAQQSALTATLTGLAAVLAVLPAPAQAVPSSVRAAHNASLFWGPFRPGLYVGTRARSPQAPIAGLAWLGATNPEDRPWEHIRHACDQSDGVGSYAFNKLDPRSFASQTIKDSKNNVQIQSSFVKSQSIVSSSDWGIRISAKPIDPDMPSQIALFFYIGFDHEDPANSIVVQPPSDASEHVRIAKGSSPGTGNFAVVFSPDVSEDAGPSTAPVIGQIPIPPDQLWKIKDIIQALVVNNAQDILKKQGSSAQNIPLSTLLQLSNLPSGQGVVIFQQILQPPFQIDIAFQSDPPPSELDVIQKALIGKKFTAALERAQDAFDARFDHIFRLAERGYDAPQIAFGKMLLSNLLGGIGYFHGTSIVDRAIQQMDEQEPTDFIESDSESDSESESDDYFSGEKVETIQPDPKPEGPFTLFSDTPSRPFFPRGFLWDSGFHQLLIGAWDNDLSLEILSSWLSLMDNDGWIAREQILGEEARSKVSQEFQTQYPNFANPPTLVMGLERFLDALEQRSSQTEAMPDLLDFNDPVMSINDPKVLPTLILDNPTVAKQYLTEAYDKFKRQYQWFRRTQWGQIAEWDRNSTVTEAYRWRGRKGHLTLTSGLDDYPRSTQPHPGELHVDLLCWIAFYSKTLTRVAQYLGHTEDVDLFTKQHAAMLYALDVLHWDEKSKTYTDLTIDDSGQTIHLPHKGYIALLPLILGLLDHNSPRVGDILDIIDGENGIWTPYGLASLSPSDPQFNTQDNYWRGPIWININYLVLRSLKRVYAKHPGPHQARAQRIFDRLRRIVAANVYSEYERTGYVWEQYSATDGHGQRSHPFTGWTSLVLMMMADMY